MAAKKSNVTVKKSPRIARGSLSADRIVAVACDLAAGVGLAELSMPQVAREMGVGVTSIYWHFRNRDELMAAIADRATQEFYAGLDYAAMDDSDDTVLEYFRIYWRRLRQSQLWREIFISHVRQTLLASEEATARSLATRTTEVGRMVHAGLSRREAFRAYAILSAYTRGFVVLDQLTQIDAHEHERSRSKRDRGDDDPLVTEPEETFERGLRSIWKGFMDAG